MFRWSVFSTAIFFIIINFCENASTGQHSVKLSVYRINGKKPLHLVSDKFLSFTVDPDVLMHIVDCQLSNASINLIRSLNPAYLRIAGPDSNKFLFQNSPDSKTTLSLSTNTNSNTKSKHLFVTGAQWIKFNEFVSKIGLSIIISLNGGLLDENTNLDLSNALEFITFSNKNNFNLDWQLGFELQRIANDDGKRTGHDVARLRKILEVFPRYQNSLILGPDMTNFENQVDISFIRNYLTEAQNSLNIFTIHPDFSGIKENDDIYEILSETMSKMDNYLWLREGVLKSVSKGVVPKKPIWIAESENKDSTCKFSDSISMIKRLGAAAKLGVSVYLQKPHLLSFYEPTSEYWVSILYKALVGRTVLDIKLTNSNTTKVNIFSHCTRILENAKESIINPALAYELGAITVYGVNTGTEPSRISFRIGFKSDETVHLYILTEESKEGNTKTLLNKQKLGLSIENELPMITPRVRESAKYIIVPARSIFFAVFPNAKSHACTSQSINESQDANKIKTKVPITDEEEVIDETSSFANNVLDAIEEDFEDDTQYVSYPKRNEHHNLMTDEWFSTHEGSGRLDSKSKIANERYTIQSNPHSGLKFITFNDDTWLSSFPDKLKEVFSREQQHQQEEGFRNPPAPNKDSKFSRQEKYRLMAQAILGKRNVTRSTVDRAAMNTPVQQDTGDITNFEFDKRKRSTRFIRSVDLPQMAECSTLPPGDSPNFIKMSFVDEPEPLIENPESISYDKLAVLQPDIEPNDLEYVNLNANLEEGDTFTVPITENIFTLTENEDNKVRKRRNLDNAALLVSIDQMIENDSNQNNTSEKTLSVNEEQITSLNVKNGVSIANNQTNSTRLNLKLLREQDVAARIWTANEDQTPNIVRANRGINDENNDVNEYSFHDANLYDFRGIKRSGNNFRPVSPFPRKIKTIKMKNKFLLPKNNDGEVIGSIQPNQSKYSTSPTSNDNNVSSVQPTHVSTSTMPEDIIQILKPLSSQPDSFALNAETNTTKIDFCTTNTTPVNNTSDKENVSITASSTSSTLTTVNMDKSTQTASSQKTAIISKIENDINVKDEPSTKSSILKDNTKSVSTKLSTNSENDSTSDQIIPQSKSDEEDGIGGDLISKIVSPKIKNMHNEAENRNVKHTNVNENDRVASSLVSPNLRKNTKKEAKTKSRQSHAGGNPTMPKIPAVTPKFRLNTQKMNTAELFDLYNAKIKQLLDQHLAKLAEVRKKINEKSTNAKKPETKIPSLLRNKREIGEISNESAVYSSSEKKNQKTPQLMDSVPDNMVSLARIRPSIKKPSNLFTSTVNLPASETSTAKAIITKKTKSSGGHHKSIRTRIIPSTTTKSIIINHNTKKTEELNRRIERSLVDDVFEKAKNICNDVTKEVEDKLNPVEKWFEKRVDDVKTEGVSKEIQKTLDPITKWVEKHVDEIKSEGLSKEVQKTFTPVAKWFEDRFTDVKNTLEPNNRPVRDLLFLGKSIKEGKEGVRENLIERYQQDINVRNSTAGFEDRFHDVECEIESNRTKRDLSDLKARIKQKKNEIREKLAEKLRNRVHIRDVSLNLRSEGPVYDIISESELNRTKRDLIALKQRIKERQEKMREKMAETFHRGVRNHDANSKRPKRDLEILKQTTKEHNDKLQEKSEDNLGFTNRLHSPEIQDKIKEKNDNHRKAVVFRSDILKNKTTRTYPHHKKLSEKLTGNAKHTRVIDDYQPMHSRSARSLASNDIFVEENEVDAKVKDDSFPGNIDFKDNLKRKFRLYQNKMSNDVVKFHEPVNDELIAKFEDIRPSSEPSKINNKIVDSNVVTPENYEDNDDEIDDIENIETKANQESIDDRENYIISHTTAAAANVLNEADICENFSSFNYFWCRAKNFFWRCCRLFNLS